MSGWMIELMNGNQLESAVGVMVCSPAVSTCL